MATTKRKASSKAIRDSCKNHHNFQLTPRNKAFEDLNRMSKAFELAEILEQAAKELQPYLDTMDAENIDFMVDLHEKIECYLYTELQNLSIKAYQEVKKYI
jgi:hypothetical protein